MTIHRLYAENGDRAGFWVQHRDWSNTCAQVQSVAGQAAGALKGDVATAAVATGAVATGAVATGAVATVATAPSAPEAPAARAASVMMHVFDVRSGRRLPDESVAHDPDDRNYARIAEPCWHHDKTRPFIPSRKSRVVERGGAGAGAGAGGAGGRRGGGR